MSNFGVGAYRAGLQLGELFGSFSEFFQAGVAQSDERDIEFKAWPEDVVLILATGDTDKFEDGSAIISPYMPVFRADTFLP